MCFWIFFFCFFLLFMKLLLNAKIDLIIIFYEL